MRARSNNNAATANESRAPDEICVRRSLKEQKNLNSFFAVMFGLSNSAARRLYKTWEVRATAHVNWCPLQMFTLFGLFQRIPSKTKRIYCSYERLMVKASL